MNGKAESERRLWCNARIITLAGQGLGLVEKACIAVEKGRIVYLGPECDRPTFCAEYARIDCDQRWITPGLIDCHTHLVHAGTRAREFEMRLQGASYEDIARSGGGIISSVRALRDASEDNLEKESLTRLDALIAEGVTTVEIKSGYGLDLDNELKSLRIARRLGQIRDISVLTTFLGAHAVPPEFATDKPGYVNYLIDDVLPVVAAAGLADAVDGFCEKIAFSPEEIGRYLLAARQLGLAVKLHADQLSDLGGAALAAAHHALSADHLEYANEAGISAMAKSGTIAVLLPGAFYFIREPKKPPIDLFRRHQIPMALATDNNPGTSPLTSLLLTMNMAATLFGMTVEECLAGVTRHAACALGLQKDIGTLEVGKWADFAIWDIREPSELVYHMGFNPLFARVFRGQQTFRCVGPPSSLEQ